MQSIVGKGRFVLLEDGKVVKRFRSLEDLEGHVKQEYSKSDWPRLKVTKTRTVSGL